MSILFNEIVGRVLQIEGGYVNDPKDSGGETNLGITVKVARKFGYTGEMKNLTIKDAKAIYKKGYWDTLKLDQVDNKKLCFELFDSCVNVGNTRAGKWLQESLNIVLPSPSPEFKLIVDGDIGNKTLECVNMVLFNPKLIKELIDTLNILQGKFYMSLAQRREKDEKFIGGWIEHRVKIKNKITEDDIDNIIIGDTSPLATRLIQSMNTFNNLGKNWDEIKDDKKFTGEVSFILRKVKSNSRWLYRVLKGVNILTYYDEIFKK